MLNQADLVTVFRSANGSDGEDAKGVHELLLQNGMASVLCDDSTPDVPHGTFEVRVPEAQAALAEGIVRSADSDPTTNPDPSPELDSVTIAQLQGTTGEIEAMGIKSILDANGIPSALVGTSTLPNLMFLVQVPASEVERARAVLDEARAAGPAAAIEAEREYDGQVPPEL